MLPPTRTGTRGRAADRCSGDGADTSRRVHLHAPARSLQRVVAARQPCLFDLVERALGHPAARRGSADDGHRRRGRLPFSTHRGTDEDGAAVRVNREAERRKGHRLTATRWRVLVDCRAALPARLERPWILYPPTPKALRFGHSRAEGQRGIGQEQECLLRRHVHEASLHLRSRDDGDACGARHDDDIAVGRFDDAAACAGQGLRVGIRHRNCGQERKATGTNHRRDM